MSQGDDENHSRTERDHRAAIAISCAIILRAGEMGPLGAGRRLGYGSGVGVHSRARR